MALAENFLSAAAGVDSHDYEAEATGLPAIDSKNMLPLLLGESSYGPRDEIHISEFALISGNYKILTGHDRIIDKLKGKGDMPFDVHGVGWGLQAVRNSLAKGRNCTAGCLFNIQEDPNEDNQIMDRPDLVAKMLNRLQELNKHNFNPNRGKPFAQACKVAVKKYRGFYGPFIDI